MRPAVQTTTRTEPNQSTEEEDGEGQGAPVIELTTDLFEKASYYLSSSRDRPSAACVWQWRGGKNQTKCTRLRSRLFFAFVFLGGRQEGRRAPTRSTPRLCLFPPITPRWRAHHGYVAINMYIDYRRASSIDPWISFGFGLVWFGLVWFGFRSLALARAAEDPPLPLRDDYSDISQNTTLIIIIIN